MYNYFDKFKIYKEKISIIIIIIKYEKLIEIKKEKEQLNFIC